MLVVKHPTLAECLPFLFCYLIYIMVSAASLNILTPQLRTNGTKSAYKMKWIRFANWVVDILVMSQILFGKLPFQWIKYISSNETVVMWLICAIHVILYYTFFEILYRRTPGKFLTNTSVQMVNNGPSVLII